MMRYKGYIANVEYDDANRIFAGMVVNTRTVITFQGTSVEELDTAFRESVDDYLKWCEEDGVEPEKPYSGRFNLRFEPELHQDAAVAAMEMGISLNRFVEKSVIDELIALGRRPKTVAI